MVSLLTGKEEMAAALVVLLRNISMDLQQRGQIMWEWRLVTISGKIPESRLHPIPPTR